MTQAKISEAWKAVQYNRLFDVESLVPDVVSQNASTFDNENHVHTLLMCAAAHGALQCCQYLIEKKANVNAKNFAGFTALHWAAYSGRTETLNLLVQSGADIEAKTEDGRTPFHIAAFRGHLEFLEEMLKVKSKIKLNISEVACNGWNALHFAVISNQKPVAKYLISLGIDTTTPDSRGETVLDLADKYKRKWLPELLKKND